MQALSNHFDVLIIGAGVSGIAAAYYVQNRCPDKSYAVIESRDDMGGTWDLFRYPGIRSDSDLYTFGYSFRPWLDKEAFASGDKIKAYIKDTARENGIDKNIFFGRRAVRASFDSAAALWTVTISENGHEQDVTCHTLHMCSGYYDYSSGYMPNFKGTEDFGGQLIHPQDWPEELDYAGKKIVVIGSGATAVTLLPSLAETAGHVTMLQRSPTYIVEMPAVDPLTDVTRRRLGVKRSHGLLRWKNIIRTIFYYKLARAFPNYMKSQIKKGAQEAIGPDFDVETHLNPTYAPWDQRVCIDKNGEMFKALQEGRASIATDTIERFTKTGLALTSGETMDADVIISATGLNLQLFGGMSLKVDGKDINMPETYFYKAMMFSGVPNLFFSIGYTNASWTLKCELISRYACRLMNEMDKKGTPIIVPEASAEMISQPAMDLDSGYILRAKHILPKQADRLPWRVYQNYILDKMALGMGSLRDSAMRFRSKSSS